MKPLALILLSLLLSACAGKYKSASDIEGEAAYLQAQMGWQTISGQPLPLTTVYGYDLIRQKHFSEETTGLGHLLLQIKQNPHNTLLFVANKKANYYPA